MRFPACGFLCVVSVNCILRNFALDTTENPPRSNRKKCAFRLSKDGKWRSFSRAPHRLQYVSSGTYFARIKIGGKIIRETVCPRYRRFADHRLESHPFPDGGAAWQERAPGSFQIVLLPFLP
jgi:hypothetical protein